MEPERSIEAEVGAGPGAEGLAATPDASSGPAPAQPLEGRLKNMVPGLASLGAAGVKRAAALGWPNGKSGGRPCLPFTEAQLETMALLSAEGMEPEQIAQTMGLRVRRVRGQLKRRITRQRVAALKIEPLRIEIEQKRALARMLPRTAHAIQSVFDRGDVKETRMMAQWVNEAVITKPTQKHEHQIQAKVEHDLAPLFAKMGEHLQILRERSRDPLARVRLAGESDVRALPSGDE